VSDHVIEAMGFERAPKNASLTARFHRFDVFCLRGVRISQQKPIIQSHHLYDSEIAIGIGNSVNAICKSMVDDLFVDDEAEWQKDKKCSPPYVVIHFGPTSAHTSALRFLRRTGKTIHTYDAFSAAKSEVRQLSDRLLPAIITALSCVLFEDGRPMPKFVPVDTAAFGLTASNETVIDTRFELSATANSASGWKPASIRKALGKVPDIVAKIDAKSASFFRLALAEKDALRRFLYFFLSIEIATHACFKGMKHDELVDKLTTKPTKQWAKGLSFLTQVEKWPNLKDRFLWCALFVWTHLSDEDVGTFARLKKSRDDIAHGSNAAPNANDVESAELLATKLHSFHRF
jgi:hypothetical protein